MARAYLAIDADVGKERAVRNALRKVQNVVRVDLVTGRYDIIAIVEARSFEALFNTVLKKVRAVKGITRTITHIAVE